MSSNYSDSMPQHTAKKATMRGIIIIGYSLLGLFQLAAIMSGMDGWVSLHWLIAIPLAFFMAYIPVLGTVAGMFGAVAAWQWSWLQSAAFFLGPLMILALLIITAVAMQRTEKRNL